MIPYIDLTNKPSKYFKTVHRSIDRVLKHGNYIGGQEVYNFETKMGSYLKNNKFAGVANGTAALFLALKYFNIGPGDEVITTPLSYLASTSSIALTGAKPVLCDIDDTLCLDINSVKNSINKKTKAILLVHLYGNIGSVLEISKLCKENHIYLIEDCAQSFGSKISNKMAGTFGDIGCFSFHPLKTLASIGDAGGMTAKKDKTIEWIKKARNHGHVDRDHCDFWSHNLRMDAIHAAVLNDILDTYESEAILLRNAQVERYLNNLNEEIISKKIKIPKKNKNIDQVYNMFVILISNRDKYIKFMSQNGVEVKVHYPYTINNLKAAKGNVKTQSIKKAINASREITSLPLGPHITDKNIDYISEKTINFLQRY